MADKLSWLLELDSKLDGATAFTKKLKEVEEHLGHAEVATSKTERKLEDAGHAGARMGQEVAAASRKYVQSLMSAGVPLDRLDRLGKILHGTGEEIGEAAKAHHAGEKGAAEHAGKAHEASGAMSELRNVTRDALKITGFRELSRAIDETKHSYVGLAEFAVGVVAFEGIKTAIELVTELGSEIVKAAAHEERMGKVFELNLGVKGGREAQEYAEKYAKNTEFSKEQTEAFATELLKAGVPLEKLDMYMAAAGDVAAKSKNPIEGMAAAVAAFSRSSLTGKIGGRQVLGLGIGLPYMKELQEFRGKSDEELKSILEDGELTTNQVMRMIAGRDGMVGDHAVEMGKTMAATLTHIGELPDRYFEKFASSPSFEVFKGKLGEILEGLDPNKEPGAGIFANLEGAVTNIVGEVAKIDFKHISEVIRDDVVPAIVSMTKAIGPILETIGKFVDGARVAGRLMANPISTVNELATTGQVDLRRETKNAYEQLADRGELPSQQSHKGAGKILDFADSFVPGFALAHDTVLNPAWRRGSAMVVDHRSEEEAAKAAENERNSGQADDFQSLAAPEVASEEGAKAAVAIDKFQSRFETAGIHAASGYVSGIRSGVEEAGRAGGELAGGALDGNAKTQESHSPSRKFARLGGYAAEGYVDGIEDGADDAARAGAVLGRAALEGMPDDRAGGARFTDAEPDVRAPGARFTDSALSVPLFSPAAAADVQRAAPGPGPVERKIEINVTVPISMPAGARTREVDDMIAKLRAMLPGTLQAAVEALAIEGGV